MIDTSWQNVLFAFSLTLFAGLSTSIGSLLTFFNKAMNEKFLSISLGFSAGVMIYISFVEILAEANKALEGIYGLRTGGLITMFSFFGGMLLIFLINNFVAIQPRKLSRKMSEEKDENTDQLMRTGILSAVAIAIHNFPEGIATFVTALDSPLLE